MSLRKNNSSQQFFALQKIYEMISRILNDSMIFMYLFIWKTCLSEISQLISKFSKF